MLRALSFVGYVAGVLLTMALGLWATWEVSTFTMRHLGLLPCVGVAALLITVGWGALDLLAEGRR